jgi:hypothetical protein
MFHAGARFLKCSAGALLTTALLVIAPIQTARADTVYTYTGNNFAGCGGLSCPSDCPIPSAGQAALGGPSGFTEIDCSINGSFTVSTSLGDNFSGRVTPSAFDFYIAPAGTPTWTNTNGAVEAEFDVVTNSAAEISQWVIALTAPGNTYPELITCLSGPLGIPPSQDSCPFFTTPPTNTKCKASKFRRET